MTLAETKSDAELVAEFLAGNAGAFEEIVRRYQGRVYAAAYDRLGRFDEAQDVAQEVFVRAFGCLASLQDPSRLGAWLRRMTANECAMRGRRMPALPLQDDVPLPDSDTERKLVVGQALEALSGPVRQTVILFYFRELSLQEIADFLEVPLSTVMSRLRNARRQMRGHLLEMTEQTLNENALPLDFAERIPLPYDEYDPAQRPHVGVEPLSEWRKNWLLGHFPEGTAVVGVHTDGEAWTRQPDLPVRVDLALPDGGEKTVVLRMSGRRGGIEREAALLPLLAQHGIAGPHLVAPPVQDPMFPRWGKLVATTEPPGTNVLRWALARDISAVEHACEVVLDAIDRLRQVTPRIAEDPAAEALEHCSLADEVRRTRRLGGPWLEDADFGAALDRIEPIVARIDEPLVFSDSGIGGNVRVDDDGGFVGWESFAFARFEDPHYQVTKYWTYDCYPLRRAGFVERYLVRHGLTMREFAPRLVVRALVTLQREIPVKGGDAAYRESMKNWLALGLSHL